MRRIKNTLRRWPAARKPLVTFALSLLFLLLLGACGRAPETPVPPSPTLPPAKVQPATFLMLKQVSADAQVYQKFELALETDGVYANPFDPAEIDLRVVFTSPDGGQKTVPAFWYQEYHQVGNAPTGDPEWRVRFTPTLPGEWSAQAVLTGKEVASEPFIFQAAAAAEGTHGFIRRHPDNPGYLAIEEAAQAGLSLKTYYPIGINMGWGGGEPLSDYSNWLDQLSANGGNVIRAWMASWSFGIEWFDTGLGDYTKRLDRAWQLDQVFEMAEQRGVSIELVLLNHGAFSATVNPEWDSNPYNLENGGMCTSPECFATDPQARELFKRRLRYIVARWGYSPNLLAWEWWNEADWTPIQDAEMADWIREMTAVIREHDPNNHLISTSYAQSSRPAINNLPEIDFAQIHVYASTDPILNFPDQFLQWAQDIPGKPVLFAEFGASAGGENADSLDQQGLHLHNGLWAATFSGFTSPAMYWWWDSYVDPLQLWPVYSRLNRFLEGVDLAEYSPGNFRLSNVNVPILVLQNQQAALVYLHDRKYELAALEQAAFLRQVAGETPEPGWVYTTEPVTDLELTVRGLEDGTYQARFYLPSEGRWLEPEASFSVIGGEGMVKLPTMQGDLAVKILWNDG